MERWKLYETWPRLSDGTGIASAYITCRYQIRKIVCCTCAGNARNVFPATDFKGNPLVSDSGMHHGTCVTHVPWCMSGSLTGGGGGNVPGIPGACATLHFTYLARGPWGQQRILSCCFQTLHIALWEKHQLTIYKSSDGLSANTLV